VRVAILGPLEVYDDGGEPVAVAGARLRDLITRLALAGGRPVSTDALAEAVWGADPPADLANALQTLVSRARRALGGAGAVEQSAAGYRLAIAPGDVDAFRFERLLAEGQTAEALALWREPALADAGEFAAPHALRLNGLRLDALVTHLGQEVDAGRSAAHVVELAALAAEHPLHEKLTALVMRALAATGRQADALVAYEALRARLADELGIDPGPEVRAVHLEVLRGTVEVADPPPRPAARGRTNLRAQLTSFVGREDEVGRVGTALATYRLVTLVGPGGAGKTRLATEVAAGARDVAPDGVWMAELASVTDAALVPHAVLDSIGLRESLLMLDATQRITSRDAQSRLVDGLADASALLVLDNCEHLIDACAHLADNLLAHSPLLRIVATSREPLGIVGESLFVVPPLGDDPAVRLFADRAAAVSPGFTLDDETTPLVTGIIQRLDGLPLAIELAAARLRTLPLAEISRRLSDRFRLLTGGSRTALPRHRTLRAVVEWSWDLLTPAERLLAERFSVFRAGATATAVADICGGTVPAVLDAEAVDELLSSLVDKSLLQPAPDGTRMRMLETIREYGAEKLAHRGEVAGLRRRHATYYSSLVTEHTPKLLTRDQLTWLRVLVAERDNIQATLRYWCDVGDAGQALTLAVSGSTLALILGNNSDITAWLAQALAVPGEAEAGLRTVAEALYVINSTMGVINGPDAHNPGQVPSRPDLAERVDALDIEQHPLGGLLRPVFAMFGEDRVRLHRYLDEALASRDEWVVATAWMLAASVAENDGDIAAMRVAGAHGLQRFRALGERWGLSSALRIDGALRLLDGDLAGAAAAYTEAKALLTEMGSQDDELFMRVRLGEIAARRGDLGAAREIFESAWRRTQADGGAIEQIIAAMSYAMFEVLAGDTQRAADLSAFARQKLALIGAGVPVRHHVVALTDAVDLEVALADGNLPLASELAASAYQAAVASKDMPLLAQVAGPLSEFALAVGECELAAEMLGACAAARGAEDPTDLMVVRLQARLREALGAEQYARAYARGRGLGRAEAIMRLDPATLDV